MGEDDNGQISLFGNELDTYEIGDQFANGDGDIYTIVFMSLTAVLLVKRSKRNQWTEVAYAFKLNKGVDWQKDMAKLVQDWHLIKLENKDNE